MNKDKIRSIIASYLKGDITSIDEAVEQIAACSRAKEMETTDAAARYLASWFGYSFDGLRDGRIGGDFKPWGFNGIGEKQFQGGKQDVQDAVDEIIRVHSQAESASRDEIAAVIDDMWPGGHRAIADAILSKFDVRRK